MRIVFFGSSHGLPEASRRCSSILIDMGKNRYFIDMGSSSAEGLANRGMAIESVKAVFVTHMHGDHTNGLISFIDICSWKYKEANPRFYLPGDVERSVAAITEWLACNGTPIRDFSFGRVDDGFIYADENIKLTAYRTDHNDHSFGYLLEAEGKRVYFSGDLSGANKRPDGNPDVWVEAFDKGLDLAVLELAHFSAVDKYYAFLKDRKNIKTICINHHSPRRIATGYALAELLSEQKFVFAHDGLEFSL